MNNMFDLQAHSADGEKRIVDLLRILVIGTEEDPLVGGGHLETTLRVAFLLKLQRQSIELQANLTQLFVLPHALINVCRRAEDQVDV